jgi:hypothetical protein
MYFLFFKPTQPKNILKKFKIFKNILFNTQTITRERIIQSQEG